jgi:hypothetical protein
MKKKKVCQWLRPGPVVAALVCLAAAMTVPMALAQSPAFNNGSLKGSYGFLIAEWTSSSSVSAFNSLGVMTFDGAGNLSGSYTANSAGTVVTGTFSGTYSVNSNGTGSMSFEISGYGTVTNAFVVDASTKNLQLLQTTCPSAGCGNWVNSGTAVAQVSTSFSNASLKGAYGRLLNKWTSDPNQQADADVGIATFNGAGKMKVSETDNTAGTVTTDTWKGTYSVNSDGTGSFAVTDSKGYEVQGVLVVNSAGKGYQFMLTSLPCGSSCGNMVMSGSGTHQ